MSNASSYTSHLAAQHNRVGHPEMVRIVAGILGAVVVVLLSVLGGCHLSRLGGSRCEAIEDELKRGLRSRALYTQPYSVESAWSTTKAGWRYLRLGRDTLCVDSDEGWGGCVNIKTSQWAIPGCNPTHDAKTRSERSLPP